MSSADSALISPTTKITEADVQRMLDRYGYSDEIRDVIANEELLPIGLLNRIQATWPQHSGLMEDAQFLFRDNKRYRGVDGFREVVSILEKARVQIGHLKERELFISIYRFLATSHVLNAIDWHNFEKNSLFQLVFPQPGMLRQELVDAWLATTTDEERQKIVDDYMEETNPHDGNQQLNKPWYTNAEGDTEFLQGSQHKYPQCALIFDQSTQDCMAFCTYCFRHAQVRGDEDMFLQKDIEQVHDYMRGHPEITDLLITGGDAGYLTYARLKAYAMPLIEDPSLLHVRTIRLGTRALTYSPEMILSDTYQKILELFDLLHDNGIQLAWMAHFSTPRELLNPATLAAIRRLQNHGVVLRSQSPMMNHISLFSHEDGSIDVDSSAQNWIDLGNLLNVMHIGFHSMYCARPTGEHHYFTAPLEAVNKIASKIHRELASINRPSRYISMTSSAGKISLLGEVEIDGQKAFALKFTEGRNMEWMDKVFLAKWDAEQNTMDLLMPWDTDEFFFREELAEIEATLAAAIEEG